MVITDRILIMTGCSYLPERLPWSSFMIKQEDNTVGSVLFYTLQCCSGQHSTTLDITFSGV